MIKFQNVIASSCAALIGRMRNLPILGLHTGLENYVFVVFNLIGENLPGGGICTALCYSKRYVSDELFFTFR